MNRNSGLFLHVRAGLHLVPLFVVVLAGVLYAEDLWVPHDPYSSRSSLKVGSVLKLVVDEPLVIEYEYDKNSDENATVKMAPDKGISDFLPAANANKNVTGTEKIRVRAKSRMQFRMAVTAAAADNDGLIPIQGTRVIAHESGQARTEIQITGKLHPEDVSAGRMIRSRDIADLQIIVKGSPVLKSANIQMKQVPTGEPNRTKNSAELSDEEKQRILLEYLNRVLGETGNQ